LFFQSFVIFAIPSTISGYILSTESNTSNIELFYKITLPIIVIGILFQGIKPYLMNNLPPLLSFGGATYQTFSYVSAFAFGLNLFFYFRKSYSSFGPFSKLFFYFIFVVTLMGVFLSGGRGGFVLVAAYLFYFSFIVFSQVKRMYIFLFFEIIIFLYVLILFNPEFLRQISEIGSFDRLFQYVNPDDLSLDWGGTSGRDEVYLNVLRYIFIKPFLGYGVYGVFNITGTPHNLFLELLLSGGVVFLTLFLIVGFVIILPVALKLIRNNSIVVIIGIYPLVQLLFSGSYLTNSEFWFVFSFMISSYFLYGKKSTSLRF
jgi:hypothetical protein